VEWSDIALIRTDEKQKTSEEQPAMIYENLLVETSGHVRLVALNHPPVNAWNLAMMTEFEDAVAAAESDGSVRVVVITGSGEKCFSAGFDVKDAANAAKTSPKGRALWTRIDRFRKPVIAAINGFALGGGFELALSCHYRIMTDDPKATIGLTELNLGIIPGWGGTQRLTRLVGRTKALELMLFSKRLDAAEALKLGLINRIAPAAALMDETMETAQFLAKRPPLAVSAVLNATSALDYEGMTAGLAAEEEGSAVVGRSEDRVEGFTAFLEKREPNFKGN
jgi:enoyl-CoA hydratase/carnithine racemase